MRRSEGVGARRVVMESTGPVLAAWLDYELRRAISYGEPRVSIDSIKVSETTTPNGDDAVLVAVVFRLSGRQYIVQEQVIA